MSDGQGGTGGEGGRGGNADVDAFLDAVPDERRRTEARTLLDLLGRVTGDEPAMWGPTIVGFGRYSYRYESGREGETFVVGFSPRKAALTMYGLQSAYAPEETADLLERLGPHKLGKGCVYISRLDRVDLGVLTELAERALSRGRDSAP
ncbi:MAG TPA: DUF1801 domain-containing protein [Naasia sp.]|jgi:hypothetical protein